MLENGPSDANQAFLYAGGEMDAAESAAFERRLGEEQALREALCQAVELMQTLDGLAPLAPNPGYRQRVRERLRAHTGFWRWMAERRSYRGHPALWSVLGAAAALLAVLTVSPSLLPVSRPVPAPMPIAEQPGPVEREAPRDVPAGPTTIEMAEVWASMHNHDHLARARDDENRRRLRLSGPITVRH